MALKDGEHVVTFTDDGFTDVRHPASEEPDLADSCGFEHYLAKDWEGTTLRGEWGFTLRQNEDGPYWVGRQVDAPEEPYANVIVEPEPTLAPSESWPRKEGGSE